MSNQRGVIVNRARKQQINDFSGLIRQRNITPTDIDGVIDYGGKSFIYMEGKFQDAPLPTGQRKAIEAIVRSHIKSLCNCIAIVFTHSQPAEFDVNVAECVVTEIYCFNDNQCQWIVPEKELNVKQVIEYFEQRYNVFD